MSILKTAMSLQIFITNEVLAANEVKSVKGGSKSKFVKPKTRKLSKSEKLKSEKLFKSQKSTKSRKKVIKNWEFP